VGHSPQGVASILTLFSILGVILVCGGASPSGGYVGGKYWHHPGAFRHGFRGVCSVFVTAAAAFSGTELVGLAAAETANPRKSLPTAVKQVFWRITLFYVVALALVGLLVPYTDKRLLNEAGQSSNAHASPFVIAIKNAGIAGLPSVMNVIIMISVLSVGNSAVYGSSRTMAALAEQGQAPAFLAYIDRLGRPVFSIIVASSFGLIAYVAASSQQLVVFDWLIATAGLSSIFTWGSICLAHIRFRKVWRIQGHGLDELAFRSQAGVIGSWVGLIFNVLVLAAQFWTGFAPIGYRDMTVSARVNNFFQAYLAAPIVISFYIIYKFRFKTKIIRTRDIDLHSGRRDLDLTYLMAEEREERKRWPAWKKVYKFFC
jgi:amino acid transporter